MRIDFMSPEKSGPSVSHTEGTSNLPVSVTGSSNRSGPTSRAKWRSGGQDTASLGSGHLQASHRQFREPFDTGIEIDSRHFVPARGLALVMSPILTHSLGMTGITEDSVERPDH